MRDSIVMYALEGAELATLTEVFYDLDATCEDISERVILILRHFGCLFSILLAEIRFIRFWMKHAFRTCSFQLRQAQWNGLWKR